MNIITAQMIDEAKKLLSTPADGSGANSQARENAIEVLEQRKENIDNFLKLNPECSENLRLSLIFQAEELENIVMEATSEDDEYGYAEQGKSFD